MSERKVGIQERVTPKGTKQYIPRWTNPDGTPGYGDVFRTRKAAETWIATEVTPKLLRGRSFDPNAGKVMFREVAAEWLASRHKLKATTKAAYAEALAATTAETAGRHKKLAHLRIDNVFGGRSLNTIRRQDISEWVAAMMAAGKKPSTVRNAYFLVRQVLGQAVADGRLDANPADYVELPTDHNTGNGTAVDDPEKYLTAAQVTALVAATPWPFNVMVHVAAWTGVRAGEMAGLCVGDVEVPPAAINPNAPVRPGTLHVQRTVGRVGKKLEYLEPKTRGSRRPVPLTSQTTAMLRDYLKAHPKAGDRTAPLFPSVRLTAPPPSTATAPAAPSQERAKRQAVALAALNVEQAEARLALDWASPMRHATFVKAVYRPAVLRANRMDPAAKIPPAVSWHALRHTYASLCVATGVIPMFEISRFMGHSKPSTTETVYAHLLRDDHSGAMAALGGLDVPAEAGNNVFRISGRRV